MRVKITKTVHVDDLASEVRKMLDQVKNRIVYGLPDQMSQIARASLSNHGEEYFQSLDLIDRFRQNLAAIDQDLQEVHNIMQGHRNALMPPETESDPEYEKLMSQTQDSEEGFYEEG